LLPNFEEHLGQLTILIRQIPSVGLLITFNAILLCNGYTIEDI